jgi:hypothetical protein
LQAFIKNLNDGVQQIMILQDTLFNQLQIWQHKQKLAQIGAPFPEKESMLKDLQAE